MAASRDAPPPPPPPRLRRLFSADDAVVASLGWLDRSDLHAKTGVPSLYIDDFTVIEEVRDLTCLRKGDHCLAALNALRKVWWPIDWVIMRLGELRASWGATPPRRRSLAPASRGYVKPRPPPPSPPSVLKARGTATCPSSSTTS